MPTWNYECLLCEQAISEEVGLRIPRDPKGVCRACTQRALRQMWEREDNMATVCIPCFDAVPSRPNVPATRFVPVKGHGTVTMCEKCWGGGQGPGMDWEPKGRAVPQDVAARPEKKPGRLSQIADRAEAEEVPPRSPGRPAQRPTGGNTGKQEREDRYRKMQVDRDNGVPLDQIAAGYGISVSSVRVYTHAPKRIGEPPKPPKAATVTATPAVNRRPINASTSKIDAEMDALIKDLEAKRAKIEADLEAVYKVWKILHDES